MPNLHRRDFLKLTAAGVGSPFVLSRSLQGQTTTAPARKLELLILGGTGFLGPAIVDAALARGHAMTLFNRGRTNADLYADLEQLRGNRDPNVDEGLAALRGRSWDAVIDTSGYVPRVVGASASLLADHVRQYVFISSISVYADGTRMGITEKDAVGTIEDETVEQIDNETYGPLKALCEQAVTNATKGRATNIRPGFIVGPRDRALGRFPLWVRRVATRDRIACPGAPDGHLQLIDARDIGDFCIRAIEHGHHGTYNAVGPATPLTTMAFIDGVCAGVEHRPERVWIDEAYLEEREHGGSFVPWIPSTGDAAGYAAVSNAKAIRDGMTFRPVSDSARDTHAWFASPDGARGSARLDEMLAAGTEDALLDAWAKRDGP